MFYIPPIHVGFHSFTIQCFMCAFRFRENGSLFFRPFGTFLLPSFKFHACFKWLCVCSFSFSVFATSCWSRSENLTNYFTMATPNLSITNFKLQFLIVANLRCISTFHSQILCSYKSPRKTRKMESFISRKISNVESNAVCDDS